MMTFCIISGENYLAKSLVLYDSLIENSDSFCLYYFCFDEPTFETLTVLKLKGEIEHIIPIKSQDYITKELLKIKESRQLNEFYWTLTPYITKYCLSNFKIDNITYLDSDLYFYDNPRILFDELKNKSVLITSHNYADEFAHLKYAGEFCVQFNTFLNKPDAIEVLEKWKNECLEWCYHKFEDGKFGDQGYLNKWPSMYPNVHVIVNEGGGLAPWNISKYNISFGKDVIKLIDKKNKYESKLVFYHFQSIRLYFNRFYYFGGYNLTKDTITNLYLPYLKKLNIKKKHLQKIKPNIDPLGNIKNAGSILKLVKLFIRKKIVAL